MDSAVPLLPVPEEIVGPLDGPEHVVGVVGLEGETVAPLFAQAR